MDVRRLGQGAPRVFALRIDADEAFDPVYPDDPEAEAELPQPGDVVAWGLAWADGGAVVYDGECARSCTDVEHAADLVGFAYPGVSVDWP